MYKSYSYSVNTYSPSENKISKTKADGRFLSFYTAATEKDPLPQGIRPSHPSVLSYMIRCSVRKHFFSLLPVCRQKFSVIIICFHTDKLPFRCPLPASYTSSTEQSPFRLFQIGYTLCYIPLHLLSEKPADISRSASIHRKSWHCALRPYSFRR